MRLKRTRLFSVDCAIWCSVLVIIGMVSTCASIGPLRAEDRRPNIVFMFTDDQPQSCLGFIGNEHIQTPNMDRLAAKGTFFNNAFVTTAICCSNRACILTGQYMLRHGIKDFRKPLTAEAFRKTYPALLREAGYRTSYLGKYAIGANSEELRHLSLPESEFDQWYGFPQSINFRQEVDGEARYLTEVMTDKAVEFLRSATDDQPFCLTVAFKEPHGPFNFFDPAVPDIYHAAQIPPPASFSLEDFEAQPLFLRESLNGDASRSWFKSPESYQRSVRTFYRTVTRADIAVGVILDELQRLGLDENTVVIFSSDHGSLLGAHGLSGKWIMYEDSIRVPLIIYDPRLHGEQGGNRLDQMALSIDLAPTMLSLAGIEIPDGMQGKNLMPLLQGDSVPWRSSWYYEHVYDTDPPRSPIAKSEGVRTQRWKYIRYPETEPRYEQLFDLETDPLEQNNLAGVPAHAARLAKLRADCDEYGKNLK